MILFHFTHPHHLPSILADGLLRPSESNVGAPYPPPDGGPWGFDAAPRVVWLLDQAEPDWPHDEAHGLSPEKRLIRFEVEVPAIPWSNWQPAAVMSADWRETFENVAGGPKAVQHWRVWPAPIRRRKWRSVVDLRTGEPVEGALA